MDFDREYQEELLIALTTKQGRQLQRLIAPDIFDEDLAPLVKELLKKKTISKGQLRQIAKRKGIEFEIREVDGCHEFDRDELTAFSQFKRMRAALAECHTDLDGLKFDKIRQRITDCCVPAAMSNGLPNLLEKRRPAKHRKNTVATGIKSLDKALGGGVSGGDVCVFLAITGGGKSSMLAYLGAQALLQGKKVYHVTLEVPGVEIEKKYLSSLCNRTVVSESKWAMVSRKLRKTKCRINVDEFPPNTVTMGLLDSRMPPDTDLCIIDYDDHMLTPDHSIPIDHWAFGAIYKEMKRVALERKIPLLTASQVNRGSYSKDRAGLQDVASSMQKVQTADQVLSLNQDAYARRQNEEGDCPASILVNKNRHGQGMIDIPVTVNFGRCVFMEAGK